MRYFHFTVYTPFVGEDADVFIEAESKEEAVITAAECANENGMEWFDEDEWLENYLGDEYAVGDAEYEEAIAEYYAQCGYHLVKEITQFEYNLAIMDGAWCV